MSIEVINTQMGVYIAEFNGVTVKVTIPGQTCNDWVRKERYLDLPMMDEDTFRDFFCALENLKGKIKWDEQP